MVNRFALSSHETRKTVASVGRRALPEGVRATPVVPAWRRETEVAVLATVADESQMTSALATLQRTPALFRHSLIAAIKLVTDAER